MTTLQPGYQRHPDDPGFRPRDVRKKDEELLSIVQEVFSSIRVVKAFAREDYEERRFELQSLDVVMA